MQSTPVPTPVYLCLFLSLSYLLYLFFHVHFLTHHLSAGVPFKHTFLTQLHPCALLTKKKFHWMWIVVLCGYKPLEFCADRKTKCLSWWHWPKNTQLLFRKRMCTTSKVWFVLPKFPIPLSSLCSLITYALTRVLYTARFILHHATKWCFFLLRPLKDTYHVFYSSAFPCTCYELFSLELSRKSCYPPLLPTPFPLTFSPLLSLHGNSTPSFFLPSFASFLPSLQ